MRMRRLVLLLLLVMLTESCAAKTNCEKNTKKACEKLDGVCQLRTNDECEGPLLIGKKYCKKWKKCGCCAPPPDCLEGTLKPCEALNGTCISKDDACDGRVVTDPAFCKWSDSCKCCFPGCDKCKPPECETEKGEVGTCSRDPIANHTKVGQMQCRDHCACWIPNTDKCKPPECETEKGEVGTCSRDPIANHTKVGQMQCRDHCACWIPNTDHCDPAWCETDDGVEGKCSQVPIDNFMNVRQLQCKDGCDCWIPECRSIVDRCAGIGEFCLDPAYSCSTDYTESNDCFKPVFENGVWVQSQLCKCCKPRKPVCEPKYDRCTKPDYCVEKGNWKCRSGYKRVYNACFKTSPNYPDYEVEESSSFSSLNITFPYSNCDCCTSLGCVSIGNKCTGKSEFCIDPTISKSCPKGYIGSEDCHKPVIINGQIVEYKECICCRPQLDCGPVCESPNPQYCQCMKPGYSCPKGLCYDDSDLCGHDSCTCCEDRPHHTECGPTCHYPDPMTCICSTTDQCPRGYCHTDDFHCPVHDCSCCKESSSVCRPIGNRCTGKREFCIDDDRNCPIFYKASLDCYKVTESGKWKLCKCCKPLFIGWVEEKFWNQEIILPPSDPERNAESKELGSED